MCSQPGRCALEDSRTHPAQCLTDLMVIGGTADQARPTCGNLCFVSGDPDVPGYVNGWRWEDPRWREWTNGDPTQLLLEALRRAVDIRDTNAQRAALSARPVMLVAVLNDLCKAMNVSGFDLWEGRTQT